MPKDWPQHPTGYYWVRPLDETLSDNKVWSAWYVISWFAPTSKLPPVIATYGPSNDSLLEGETEVRQFLDSHEWGDPVLQPEHPDFQNPIRRFSHRLP